MEKICITISKVEFELPWCGAKFLQPIREKSGREIRDKKMKLKMD